MMATERDVKNLIDTELTEEQVTPFLETAELFLQAKGIYSVGHSAALLKKIEAWTGAHFVAIRDPRVKSEVIGEGPTEYQGQVGKGLQGTMYGQQAVILDTSGRLAGSDTSSPPFVFEAV